jgi:flagellin
MTSISLGTRGSDQQFLRTFQRNSDRLQTSLERLSTGKRINRPSDDPSGFIAAEGFRRDLADLKIKLNGISRERQQGHVRQSGLANIQTALVDLRDRVLAAADGFISAEERAAIEYEIGQAVEAVNRIADQTGNAGVAGINPAAAATLPSADPAAAELIDQQSQGVSQERVALAAHERTHLDTFEQLYQDQIVITSEALSQIEDTDFAAETATLVQSQILSQGAMAALSYANRQHIDQITLLLDEIV